MSEETGDSPTNPITQSGPDRRMKWCRCSGCNTVRLCTPEFDFYSRPAPLTMPGDLEKPGKPLLCRECFAPIGGGVA